MRGKTSFFSLLAFQLLASKKPCRVAGDGRMRRHVFGYDAAGADDGVFVHGDPA